jgi:hypothetical protein
MTMVGSPAITFSDAELKAKGAADLVIQTIISSTVDNVSVMFEGEADRQDALARLPALAENQTLRAGLESSFVSWLADVYVLLPPADARFQE